MEMERNAGWVTAEVRKRLLEVEQSGLKNDVDTLPVEMNKIHQMGY